MTTVLDELSALEPLVRWVKKNDKVAWFGVYSWIYKEYFPLVKRRLHTAAIHR